MCHPATSHTQMTSPEQLRASRTNEPQCSTLPSPSPLHDTAFDAELDYLVADVFVNSFSEDASLSDSMQSITTLHHREGGGARTPGLIGASIVIEEKEETRLRVYSSCDKIYIAVDLKDRRDSALDSDKEKLEVSRDLKGCVGGMTSSKEYRDNTRTSLLCIGREQLVQYSDYLERRKLDNVDGTGTATKLCSNVTASPVESITAELNVRKSRTSDTDDSDSDAAPAAFISHLLDLICTCVYVEYEVGRSPRIGLRTHREVLLEEQRIISGYRVHCQVAHVGQSNYTVCIGPMRLSSDGEVGGDGSVITAGGDEGSVNLTEGNRVSKTAVKRNTPVKEKEMEKERDKDKGIRSRFSLSLLSRRKTRPLSLANSTEVLNKDPLSESSPVGEGVEMLTIELNSDTDNYDGKAPCKSTTLNLDQLDLNKLSLHCDIDERAYIDSHSAAAICSLYADRMTLSPSQSWQHFLSCSDASLLKSPDVIRTAHIRTKNGPGKIIARKLVQKCGRKLIISLYEIFSENAVLTLRICIYDIYSSCAVEFRVSGLERQMFLLENVMMKKKGGSAKCDSLMQRVLDRLLLTRCNLLKSSRVLLPLSGYHPIAESNTHAPISCIDDNTSLNNYFSDTAERGTIDVDNIADYEIFGGSEMNSHNSTQQSKRFHEEQSTGHTSHIVDLEWALSFNRSLSQSNVRNLKISVGIITHLKTFTVSVQNTSTLHEVYKRIPYERYCALKLFDSNLETLESSLQSVSKEVMTRYCDALIKAIGVGYSESTMDLRIQNSTCKDYFHIICRIRNSTESPTCTFSGALVETDQYITEWTDVFNPMCSRTKHPQNDVNAELNNGTGNLVDSQRNDEDVLNPSGTNEARRDAGKGRKGNRGSAFEKPKVAVHERISSNMDSDLPTWRHSLSSRSAIMMNNGDFDDYSGQEIGRICVFQSTCPSQNIQRNSREIAVEEMHSRNEDNLGITDPKPARYPLVVEGKIPIEMPSLSVLPPNGLLGRIYWKGRAPCGVIQSITDNACAIRSEENKEVSEDVKLVLQSPSEGDVTSVVRRMSVAAKATHLHPNSNTDFRAHSNTDRHANGHVGEGRNASDADVKGGITNIREIDQHTDTHTPSSSSSISASASVAVTVREVLSSGCGVVRRGYRVLVLSDIGTALGHADIRDDAELRSILGGACQDQLLLCESEHCNLSAVFDFVMRERVTIKMSKQIFNRCEGVKEVSDICHFEKESYTMADIQFYRGPLSNTALPALHEKNEFIDDKSRNKQNKKPSECKLSDGKNKHLPLEHFCENNLRFLRELEPSIPSKCPNNNYLIEEFIENSKEIKKKNRIIVHSCQHRMVGRAYKTIIFFIETPESILSTREPRMVKNPNYFFACTKHFNVENHDEEGKEGVEENVFESFNNISIVMICTDVLTGVKSELITSGGDLFGQNPLEMPMDLSTKYSRGLFGQYLLSQAHVAVSRNGDIILKLMF